MIGEENGAGAHRIGIVLAACPRCGEAVADLDALHRIDRHAGGGELAVELRVDGGAPARRNAIGDTFDHGADRGTALAHILYPSLPPQGGARVRAAEGSS